MSWKLTDEVTSDVWVLEIGPKDGVEVEIDNPLAYINTTAEDGDPIYYGQQAAPSTMSWSSTILSIDERDKWREWGRKPYPVILTNDLGERYRIRFTKVTPKRVQVVNRPYKATVDVAALVITILPNE